MDATKDMRALAEACAYAAEPEDVDYEVDDSVDALINYKDGLEDLAGQWGEALAKVNDILSYEEWSVSMLEDITDILRTAGIEENPNPPEYHAH